MIAQDLWQAHYQIILIILLTEFIKLDVHIDMTIKNMKHEGLNRKYQKTIDENLKKFRDTYKFKFILFPRKGIYLDECMDA